MNITLCAYDAPNNIDGPSSWLKRLLPYLRTHGVETRILFVANRHRSLGTLAYFSGLGFACKLVPAELFFEEQIAAIIDDIRLHPPDVFIPNFIPAAAYANTWIGRSGISSILVLHNDDAYHHALVEEFITGDSHGKVTAVVPVSRQLEGVVKAGGHGHIECVTIPYGAPLPPLPAEAPDGELRLVYMGRLNEHQKKISEVTLALCRAAREIDGVRALIYGSGTALPSVLQILQREAEGRVRYEGALVTADVQTHLLRNHVFVLLSEYEGIPVALMEAMACGLVPVVSNIRSGINELVRDGENGTIVSDRSDAFVEAIRLLKMDSAKWKRLSANARQTITDGFSDTVCHAAWLELLQKLRLQSNFTGQVPVPSLREIAALRFRPEFIRTETLAPAPLLRPLYRLKKSIGRLKRNLFE